ncbi:hypothetical protein [Streptomyces sp. NPDC089915]|uniref:hypothetical protein n=1 Tax=Streptomyces sp. NPDC089915 TaxID=3155186 RepID=UPI003445B363
MPRNIERAYRTRQWIAGYEHWMELAYIRDASGREFTTAVANVQPAYDQPPTDRTRRTGRSA